MKFLFDLFPIILFFGAFKGAEQFPESAISLAGRFLGDNVTAMTAPVFIATAVAILATFAQVAWLLVRGKKVEPMLWISLTIIVVFGGLTLWLKNEMFIKWKPSILYWVFASILCYGTFARKNFIKLLLGKQIDMPLHAWNVLQTAWIIFFVVVGILNLIVAYTFSTDTWVNFKLFGLMALTLIFTIGMGFYIARFTESGQN